MSTPAQSPKITPTRALFALCALSGIALMGIPCAHNHDGGDDPAGRSAQVTSTARPANAHGDPAVQSGDVATLTIDGFEGAFVFTGDQTWNEYEDGSATLDAELADAGNRERRLRLTLTAREPRTGEETALDALSLALDPSSYKDAGGAIDPTTWRLFEAVTGELVGLRLLEGTRFTLRLAEGKCFQMGSGANNANLFDGAFAPLTWTRVSGAADTEPTGVAQFAMTLGTGRISRVLAARSEAPYHGGSSRHAVTLPGIASPLVFVAGGHLVENPDGTARLVGVLEHADHPAKSFHIDVALSGRVEPGAGIPEGSPKLELTDESYVDAGGPVDPATWTYYEQFEGTLIGLRDYRGAVLQLTRRGPAFQIGLGASGKNSRLGGAGWLDTVVLQQPASGVQLTPSRHGDINIDLNSAGMASCAMPARKDEGVARFQGGHALWIPGLATDFEFEPGALFTEHPDGTATLAGTAFSRSQPELRFRVQAELGDRMDPGSPGHAPMGSPKLELQAGAYVDAGGSVDPAGWHYYGTLIGDLIGVGPKRGAHVRLERFGPAFQVGLGASGKNGNFGGSGWLEVSVLAQPESGPALPDGIERGDFNLDFGIDCGVCAMAAPRNPEVSIYQGEHAFYLPGISHDFMFEAGASFVESADGTARLAGVLFSPTRPGWRFLATVELTDRIDPGSDAWPPAGSPKRELTSETFVDAGGTVDVDTWRYYGIFSGTLVGLDELEGAEVHVTRTGPAFQVGEGASGKNVHFGGAGWIDVELVAQPTTGISLPGTLARGDINVDFAMACMECAVDAPLDDEVSRLGNSEAFYFSGLEGTWFEFEGPASFAERGDGTAALTGILRGVSGDDNRWSVELEFTDRYDPIMGDPLPATSPKRDLRNARFMDQGGPIDFMQWRYYATTEGVLRGLGQHDGAEVRLWRMGPSFQVGIGASGRNERYGASGWLHTEVLSQPTSGPTIQVNSGDFNVDLGAGCDMCAAPAMLGEEMTTTSGDHAFYFPGIGTDFVFDGPAPLVERPDGTARLTGVIYRPNEPGKRFRVEVELWDKVEPGSAAHPPAQSPKKELFTRFYVDAGGPIDPSAWRYYESFEGRAFGMDEFEGGELLYTRFGPAFQVGLGASGKNLEFGGAGWLDVQIVSQPSGSPPFQLTPGLHGDINVVLLSGCE